MINRACVFKIRFCMLRKMFSSWLLLICKPVSQILCAFTILCCALCIGLLFFGCDDDKITLPPDELSPEKELLTLYHPVGYITAEDRSASILTEENHAGWKKADCTKCHRSPSEDAPHSWRLHFHLSRQNVKMDLPGLPPLRLISNTSMMGSYSFTNELPQELDSGEARY